MGAAGPGPGSLVQGGRTLLRGPGWGTADLCSRSSAACGRDPSESGATRGSSTLGFEGCVGVTWGVGEDQGQEFGLCFVGNRGLRGKGVQLP